VPAIDSSLLAAWVGALGTVAAFMAAAVAWIYSLYATRRDNRVAQARGFVAWTASARYKSDVDPTVAYSAWAPFRDPKPFDPTFVVTVAFFNASNLAVLNVKIEVYSAVDGLNIFRDTNIKVPPTPAGGPLERTYELNNAPAELLSRLDAEKAADRIPDVAPLIDVDLSFLDSAGLYWFRDRSGRLSGGRPPPPPLPPSFYEEASG
jgi:hypothetical protein